MKKNLRIHSSIFTVIGLILLEAIFVCTGISKMIFAQEQESPVTYVITSQDRVNARECPQLTCAVVQRFAPGVEITVIEIVTGDPVGGNDQWLHVRFDDADVYVH